jgi:peptidyl-prolyl cis-trans isomerase SurA
MISPFISKLRNIALIFACLTAVASAQTVIEDIVARVNDQIVTRSDLQRAKEATATEMKQKDPNTTDKDIADKDKDVLRDLIDQNLLVQRGKDLGITGDTELIKRLDDIRKSMNLDSMEDLEKAAQAQGVSFEDFKKNMRNDIVTQSVIGQEVGRKMVIAPSEIGKYYEEHKASFVQPEQVVLAEIMASTGSAEPAVDKKEQPQMAEDPAKVVAAEARAHALLEEIHKGAKFEDVAKKSSDGPTASQGGVLGAFKRGALAKELEDKVFAMKKGDVSDVIRTKQGFIILKVLDHQQAGIPPQKDVEQQIQEALYYERLQPALRSYLTKLREDAYIDIKPGFVDTGASPNQTKPIVVAAVNSPEEAAQKAAKKKKKKMLIF